MKSIIEDIENSQLQVIYLLYGKEAYLRKQYRDKLKVASIDGEDTMNFHYFHGKSVNFLEVIDLAQTLPFFAQKRVIVIENSEACKTGGEQFSEYVADIPESCAIIIVDEEVDKRSKLYKAIQKKGRAVEFPLQNEVTLKRWINNMVRQEGKVIEGRALHRFLEKTGTDMSNIKIELEKLICYTLEREEILIEDIEAISTTRISNQIFKMIDAIAIKQQKRALQLYYDLLALKEPPLRILFLIARQFNYLLQVKQLGECGMANQIIAQRVGLQPFVVTRYINQARQFSLISIRKALESCVSAETDVKTGKMNDKISVELLIVTYTS